MINLFIRFPERKAAPAFCLKKRRKSELFVMAFSVEAASLRPVAGMLKKTEQGFRRRVTQDGAVFDSVIFKKICK